MVEVQVAERYIFSLDTITARVNMECAVLTFTRSSNLAFDADEAIVAVSVCRTKSMLEWQDRIDTHFEVRQKMPSDHQPPPLAVQKYSNALNLSAFYHCSYDAQHHI